jgi:hypothetical protein
MTLMCGILACSVSVDQVLSVPCQGIVEIAVPSLNWIRRKPALVGQADLSFGNLARSSFDDLQVNADTGHIERRARLKPGRCDPTASLAMPGRNGCVGTMTAL